MGLYKGCIGIYRDIWGYIGIYRDVYGEWKRKWKLLFGV